jgi:Tfp pilus assembly protein PilV
MKTLSDARRKAGGFTLAEIVVASGIIAIGFLGSFAMVMMSGKQASAAEESSLVSTAMEQQIDLLRTLSWPALTSGTGITSTVWSAQPLCLAGMNITQETITISAYGQANTQTLTATWNVPGAQSVVLAPAVGGTTVALSTATAVQVVTTMTYTGHRSGRSRTQTLATVISQGGISNSVLP